MTNKQKPQIFDFDYKACSKEVLFEKFQTSAAGLSEQRLKNALTNLAPMKLPENRKELSFFSLSSSFFTPWLFCLLL